MKHYIPLLLTIAAASNLHADIVLSGSFSADDASQIFAVNMASAGTLTVQSLGYGGSVPHAVASGGFDTVLSLFSPNPARMLLALNNDGACPLCFDAGFSLFLNPGTYWVVLTQYDNLPFGPAFADGFSRTGQGNFTPGLSGFPGTSFLDSLGNQRTSQWTVRFDGATSVSAVPEPSTYAFLLAAALALPFAKRRTAKHTSRN